MKKTILCFMFVLIMLISISCIFLLVFFNDIMGFNQFIVVNTRDTEVYVSIFFPGGKPFTETIPSKSSWKFSPLPYNNDGSLDISINGIKYHGNNYVTYPSTSGLILISKTCDTPMYIDIFDW